MRAREIKEFRDRAISSLKELPEDKLRVAVDFIEYLRSREEWEATWEIMGDEKMMADIKAADEDWEAGRSGKFTPWDEIKRNV